MTDAPKLLLAHHLKTLKLPTFLREYAKLARQCAAEGRDHVQFLARLVELELIDRDARLSGPSGSPRATGRNARNTRARSYLPRLWLPRLKQCYCLLFS